jgi:carbohydrate-binding DOMON domain-containing protein
MLKRMWALVLLLALLAGCSDDDSNPTDPQPTRALPRTPQELMQAVVAVQEEMDLEELAFIAHPDARVFLLESTLQEWEASSNPLGFSYFQRGSLLAVHGNIFSGEQGLTPVGNPIPPVQSIDFAAVEALQAWAPFEDPAGEFPGLEVGVCPYAVRIYFNNPDFHRYQVQGVVEFFAVEVGSGDSAGWQLLGWRESEALVTGGGTESTSWGDILTMYR